MQGNSEKYKSQNLPEIPAEIKCKILNAYAITGQQFGEILLFWEPVADAVCYVVESKTGESNNWIQLKLLSLNHLKIDTLDAGAKHYFRIAPITANGPGEWSDVISADINSEF